MSKTKFIKVPVSERLPDESGKYNTDCGLIDYSCHTKIFFSNNVFNYPVGYWLDEVPDREDEMREVLERAKLQLDVDSKRIGSSPRIVKEIEQLLNTLK